MLSFAPMTRDDAIARKAELEKRRDALVDQLSAVDASSASVSAGGGSQSYTSRSVAEIKAKITSIDREIARIDFRLGNGGNLAVPKSINLTFNG